MNITVYYDCIHCHTEKAPVSVPSRLTTDNLMNWLDRTCLLLAEDHLIRSPNCYISEFTSIMIPYLGERIGAVSVN